MTDAPIPSPNIWDDPDLYETENLGVDRAGVIEAAMRGIQDWRGLDVLDLGCGTGFHLPRFAETARSVVGVEPHPPLVERARARVAGLAGLAGLATAPVLPRRPASSSGSARTWTSSRSTAWPGSSRRRASSRTA